MITREERQRLIAEYARRNDGVYDPRGFMLEVAEQGRNHPAYEWFQWDDTAAAEGFRVDQARKFAQGLTVVFEVQQVGGGVVQVKAPASHSPIKQRLSGGGYRVTDLSNEDHVDELRRQALQDLAAWRKRYAAILGGSGPQVEALKASISSAKLEAA